ncbi:hypothetical protein AZ010_001252, partial [Klebsiella pneumoniae]
LASALLDASVLPTADESGESKTR